MRVGDREANDRPMNDINRFPAPIRERRAWYEQHPDYTRGTLRVGAKQEQLIANWKPSQCTDGRLCQSRTLGDKSERESIARCAGKLRRSVPGR